MTTVRGYDASTPPTPVPSGYEVTGGYIGGATPHVWTPEEWASKACKRKLPIYVPQWFRTGAWAPGTDAMEAVRALKALGVPTGATVGLDMETQVNVPYVNSFDSILTESGYKVLVYGSSSTVFKNERTSAGYWVATRPGNPDFSGFSNLYPGSTATQIQDVGPYDVDIFDSSLVFWGDEIPAPTPAPVTDWLAKVIANLPTLTLNATGNNVRTLQGLLCARGFTVSIDGKFGADTEAAVKRAQVALKIPNSVTTTNAGDGRVGPHTWATLVSDVAQ